MSKIKKWIYTNPRKYAKKCDIPLNLAKIECRKQKQIAKKRKKIKCPICKHKALHFCMGSYEEGYGDYVECENCGEAFEPDEINNSELLCWGADFDAVLYYAGSVEGHIEACGSAEHERWVKFARHMIVGYR